RQSTVFQIAEVVRDGSDMLCIRRLDQGGKGEGAQVSRVDQAAHVIGWTGTTGTLRVDVVLPSDACILKLLKNRGCLYAGLIVGVRAVRQRTSLACRCIKVLAVEFGSRHDGVEEAIGRGELAG